MTPRTRIHLRFAAWILAVSVALPGQTAWLLWMRFAPSAPLLEEGRIVVLLSLGMMLVLLCSTPANAIRLPRRMSEGLIFTGGVGLQLLGGGPMHWLAVLIATALLAVLRMARQSPWWAGLVAWFPL